MQRVRVGVMRWPITASHRVASDRFDVMALARTKINPFYTFRGMTLPRFTATLSVTVEAGMSETELVSGARRGEQAAFADLVCTYQTPVYNLCYRMLGDFGEAEDASQETFLRAWRQLDRYDPDRPLKTWLFSIAAHHCIDRLRRRRITWRDIEDEALSGHPALAAPTSGPEQRALQAEQAASVQSLLIHLPPPDRAAIVMRYWYDLSYVEIAAATGATVSAVKSRLHRARTTLGGLLAARVEPVRERRNFLGAHLTCATIVSEVCSPCPHRSPRPSSASCPHGPTSSRDRAWPSG